MKIREFSATHIEDDPHSSFKLMLKRPNRADDNSFSILVGTNGTRKSRTLRDIIDLAVLPTARTQDSIKRKSGQMRFWTPSRVPRVIAVSGVATDRFPSRISSRTSKTQRASYSYIGPRTDNNLVSRAQAINQIASAIISDPERIKARAEQLRHAFTPLEFGAGIFFEFELEEQRSARWGVTSLKKRLEESRAYTTGALGEEEIIKRSARFMRSNKNVEIRLDLDDEDVIDSSTEEWDILNLLLQSGLMRVSKCYVVSEEGDNVDLHHVSSGQWHMLSSLIFVAATVENESLILVDEPENSLHPAWQQDYLPLLQSSISSTSGVHVIVSTHSPHVASSLMPDIAEVIGLYRNRHGITAKNLKGGPYGWGADDILRTAFGLDSTRSRLFTEDVDATLKLFAKGDRKNPELIRRVSRLRATALNLPSDDAVREMMETMPLPVLN